MPGVKVDEFDRRGTVAEVSEDVQADGVHFLDLEEDCVLAVAEQLRDVASLVRLAASCSTLRRIFGGAQPREPMYRRLANRTWGRSLADVRHYTGDWRSMCLDDNARNSVASVVVKVPVSALQWPEDVHSEYQPYRCTVELTGCSFQVSAGFLFQQDGRFGPTLDVGIELLSPSELSRHSSFHVLLMLHRKYVPAEDDEKSPMFSTYCSFNASNPLLFFKHCASCSTLLTERLGYMLEPANDNGEEQQRYVQLQLDALRVWDSVDEESTAARGRPGTRRVPVISCHCAPAAELGLPDKAVRALIRRGWSASPLVKDVAWRYMWHLLCTARFYKQDKVEKLCQALAAVGAVQLMLASCTSSDENVAWTALQIISVMTDAEEVAEMFRHERAIEVLSELNFRTKHRRIRRGTGEAIASLVPLDAEGLSIIRRLKLL